MFLNGDDDSCDACDELCNGCATLLTNCAECSTSSTTEDLAGLTRTSYGH